VTAALEATGLGKRYGRNTWALRDCNLVVPRGRIAALVGPNGAGKTTLLHLAVGLLSPTAGTVRVLDQPAGASDLVSRVGVPLDRRAGALARREFLQTLMGAVAEQGVTVLLSSHLLADLERVCDYLIVLSAAHVQVLGTTEELLAQHKLLIGPYREAQPPIAGVAQVVRASHTDRQATLLARTNGPIHDPAWKAHEVTLEDVVLAYLAEPSAAALPGPSAQHSLEV
jgi:ABC-2 type transport system ATP-binding protein